MQQGGRNDDTYLALLDFVMPFWGNVHVHSLRPKGLDNTNLGGRR